MTHQPGSLHHRTPQDRSCYKRWSKFSGCTSYPVKAKPLNPMSWSSGTMKVLSLCTWGRGLKLTGGVFLSHSAHFFFFWNKIWHWIWSKSQGSSCRRLLSAEIIGTHCTQIFMWATGFSKMWVLLLPVQQALLTETSWQPTYFFKQTFSKYLLVFKLCLHVHICMSRKDRFLQLMLWGLWDIWHRRWQTTLGSLLEKYVFLSASKDKLLLKQQKTHVQILYRIANAKIINEDTQEFSRESIPLHSVWLMSERGIPSPQWVAASFQPCLHFPNVGHISLLLLPHTDFVCWLVLYGIVIVYIYSARLHGCNAGFVRFRHIVCSGSLFVSLLIGYYTASSTMGDGHLVAFIF